MEGSCRDSMPSCDEFARWATVDAAELENASAKASRQLVVE